MKAQLLLLAAVLGGAIAIYLWYQPESRQAPVEPTPTVTPAEPAPEIPAPPPIEAAKTPPAPIEPLNTDIVIPPDAGVADAAPTGPFTIDLGEHTIHLRDKPWVLHVHPQLVTSSFTTRGEISRLRRTLVRMLFFLGSHRTRSGSEGPEGEARFKADLLERLRNVVKTGPVDALNLVRYEVAEYEPPPPQRDPNEGQ